MAFVKGEHSSPSFILCLTFAGELLYVLKKCHHWTLKGIACLDQLCMSPRAKLWEKKNSDQFTTHPQSRETATAKCPGVDKSANAYEADKATQVLMTTLVSLIPVCN